MKKIYSLFFLFSIFIVKGQNLKPSIGLVNLPADASTICAIPTYTGSFTTSGYMAGDTIPHFQLYDKNGTGMDVLTVLQTGKPLLLIAGAYTCPVFRQKIVRINQVAATYSNQINIYVVYVVEAHPVTPDVSPYSGGVWTTSENQTEGILYAQPTTYGVKKQMVNNMLANNLYTLSVPVLIDGPCNAWWLNFGPAPNNAYLIWPNGVIYKKHGWFDKAPENIMTDINSMLTGMMENPLMTSMVNVYPDPVQNELHFNIPNEMKDAVIEITDITGKKLITEKKQSEKDLSINISSFQAGMYFYSIVSSKGVLSNKFIKE